MEPSVQVGDRFPLEALRAQTGARGELEGLTVVYFYPRAGTETCTREALEFNRRYDRFEEAGITVVGVSADPQESLERFAAEHGLRFPLVSDAEGALTAALGLMKTYGEHGEMAARVTFLLDSDAVILGIWRVEDVIAHPGVVLEEARALLAERS